MKYAILIESKNMRFAALERIAQIINPSVDLEIFSFECSEPIAINYSLAESLASKYRLRFLFLHQRDGDFQVINLHTGTIRALPAEPYFLNRAIIAIGLDPFKPYEFEDDWAVASTILQEWKFLYRHFPLMK